MSNSEYNADDLMVDEESEQQKQNVVQSYTQPAQMGKEAPDTDSEKASDYSDNFETNKGRRG